MNYRRFRTTVFFRQSVGCRVRRAIINNDDFKIGKRLRQNAVHRFAQAFKLAGLLTVLIDSTVQKKPSPFVFNDLAFEVAGEPGLEPRLTESESAVLPLNYSPTI